MILSDNLSLRAFVAKENKLLNYTGTEYKVFFSLIAVPGALSDTKQILVTQGAQSFFAKNANGLLYSLRPFALWVDKKINHSDHREARSAQRRDHREIKIDKVPVKERCG